MHRSAVLASVAAVVLLLTSPPLAPQDSIPAAAAWHRPLWGAG